MMVTIVVLTIAVMAAAVSLGSSGCAQCETDSQAEAGNFFHGLAHNQCISKPNNATGALAITCNVYASVSNCCWRTVGMCCETIRLLQQAMSSPDIESTEAEMKKGLVLTRPSIKIAGAQEGTRTPTELPAST